MGYQDRIEADDLVGEVLTHIDVDGSGGEILLTTESGRQIKIYHEQNCCESVGIEDTQGNWHDLIGKPLVEAKQEVDPSDEPEREYYESGTLTRFTFRVNDATVINRWIGTSNGFYSETVTLEDVSKDR